MTNTTRPTEYALATDALEMAAVANNSRWHAGELENLATARRNIEELTAQAVTEARFAGETWAQIAASLGITKQGAQQRYGR